MTLRRSVTAATESPVADLFAVVEDLGTYADWLDIVHTVEPAPAHPDDEGPAWFVTLRAQVGRFARSKRLRIVQVDHRADARVRFERREHDGRDHAEWTMVCTVTGDLTSELVLDLVYTGRLWSGVLDAVLGDEIDQALVRLPAFVANR